MQDSVQVLERLLQDLDAFRAADAPPDSTLPSIAKRIAQDMEYIRDEDDMAVIASHVAEFHVFGDTFDEATTFLVETDSAADDPRLAYVYMSLLLHLGVDSPNVYRKMAQHDWTLRLRTVVMAATDAIDEPLLDHLCNLVEMTRDMDVSFNHAIISLLLCLNSQLLKKRGSTATRQRLVKVLAGRLQHCKTLSENIIYMFNRSDNPQVQLSIVLFLTGILQYQPTQHLFYTNDLTVMVDVIVRDALRVSDDNEELADMMNASTPHQLQHAYLNLMPLVLAAGAGSRSHKQVQSTLRGLAESNFAKPSTRRLAARLLNEMKPE
ncbi:hypothetical protein BC831DRAFT_512105 [Entophlyctis helioformis]|nr:hypothetical protein BC831DRAFT_512105 [Entophlyctis helioformis]